MKWGSGAGATNGQTNYFVTPTRVEVELGCDNCKSFVNNDEEKMQRLNLEKLTFNNVNNMEQFWFLSNWQFAQQMVTAFGHI